MGASGVILLGALYASVGFVWLSALRLTGGSPWTPVAVALAVITGWAVVGIVVSLLLMAGASLSIWKVAGAVGAAVLPVAAVLRRRRSALRADRMPSARDTGLAMRAAGIAGAAVVVLVLGAALARALTSDADTEWDVWAFWLAKAKAIYYFGGLDVSAGGFTSYANPEYPPMAPAVGALGLHMIGDDRPALLLVHQWLLSAGFFGGAAALLTRHVRPGLVWPPLAMLAAAPGVDRYVDSVLADPQVAFCIGLAAVSAVLWHHERRPGHAFLVATFVTAASLLKTEGLILGLALVAAMGIARIGTSAPRWPLPVVAAAPVAATVAWKAWLASHDQPLSSALYSVGDAFRPDYLVDRIDRLEYALRELSALVLSFDLWLLTLPLTLAAAALAFRADRRTVSLAIGWLGAGFLGLAAVYWISSAPVEWYVDTSAQRVLTSIVVAAGVTLPLFLERVDRLQGFGPERRPSARRD